MFSGTKQDDEAVGREKGKRRRAYGGEKGVQENNNKGRKMDLPHRYGSREESEKLGEKNIIPGYSTRGKNPKKEEHSFG